MKRLLAVPYVPFSRVVSENVRSQMQAKERLGLVATSTSYATVGYFSTSMSEHPMPGAPWDFTNDGSIDWTDQFVTYVSSFDEGFAERLSGASVEQIAALEEALRRPIPSTYRYFLRRMGQDGGGLFDSERFSFGIDLVVGFIQEYRNDFPSIDFTHCIPIGYGDVWEGWGLMTSVGEDPPVVELNDGKADLREPVVASSLKAFVFLTGFRRQVLFRSYSVVYRSTRLTVPESVEHLNRLEFRRPWFDRPDQYHAQRGSTLVQVCPIPVGLQLVVVTSRSIRSASQRLSPPSTRRTTHRAQSSGGLGSKRSTRPRIPSSERSSFVSSVKTSDRTSSPLLADRGPPRQRYARPV